MAASPTESHEALSEDPFDYQEYDNDSKLTLFLEKEDLIDLQTALGSLNIDLTYLQYVESDQLNRLCDKLRLEIGSSTRLQFTRAVVKLQSEYKETKKLFKKRTIVDEKENHQQKEPKNKNLLYSKDNIAVINGNNKKTKSKLNNSYTTKLQSPRDRGYDYIIKCILLGDSNVGKSCILVRYVDEKFDESTIFTVGIDYRMKTIELGDDLVKYQIWDTAGQEKYRTIISAYYRGIDAALLCYDITNRESFQNISNWIQNVQQYSSDNVFMMLVGTKLDLVNHDDNDDNNYIEREITREEGKELAEEYGIKFCEVSSKSGHGITSMFLTTASYAILNKKKEINQIKKQRALTQEKVDLLTAEITESDNIETTDKFVKKKCCNIYI